MTTWKPIDLGEDGRPMRELRAVAGLSQAEALALLGVAASTLTSPEQKSARRLLLSAVLDRAEALGLELEIRARKP